MFRLKSPRLPGLSTMDAEIAAEIAPGARFGPHDDQFLAWSMLKLEERKKTHVPGSINSLYWGWETSHL